MEQLSAPPRRGLVSYGVYIPYHRLTAGARAAVLGGRSAKRSRAVASYDEDTTTMAVAAARTALRSLDTASATGRVYLATTRPPYLDKTNATLVHAVLGLPGNALAVDVVGASRSGLAAFLAGVDAPEQALVLLSELRVGFSGGAEEIGSGDAAAAFVFAEHTDDAPVLAELVATGWATDEFLDRWRVPGEQVSHVWEDRFGEHAYARLGPESFATALGRAGLAVTDIDHVIVCGLSARAVAQFQAGCGAKPDRLVDARTDVIGNTGLAQPGVVLADILDRAEPDQTIAVVHLADGASTLILRTTAALTAQRRPQPSVAAQVAAGHDGLPYAKFLAWRGLLSEEPPRRPEPEAPAAPPTLRAEHFKYGFVGSRCNRCGTVHLPPARVCFHCGAVDDMTDKPMADTPAVVATRTVDRLAFTASPPMIAVVVDFEGGGRFRCEATDAEPEAIGIGDRVELTFRRLFTTHGVHNYFWKARPARTGPADHRATKTKD
jgi:hydroxymethylglutaryl-CoA synthase